MSPRGRKAARPAEPVRRPAVLADDSLTVHHRTKNGERSYDFTSMPVAAAMQRSWGALFAARCAPGGGWDSLDSSMAIWNHLRSFAAFLAKQERPPADIPQLTAGLWAAWRLACGPETMGGYKQITVVAGFLQRDGRLPQAVRQAMAKRVKPVKPKEKAFLPEEFQAVKTAARRTFRSAVLRIRENTEHLEAWRNGAFEAGSPDWLIGEALDTLARTGHVPRYQTPQGKYCVVGRYLRALGGSRAEVTWQRLYPSRAEISALGALLVTEHGANATTVSEMPVPRATPDSGERSGVRVYRVEWEKRRRGSGRHFETRNLTDSGADSPGRLITEALEVTAHARSFVTAAEPELDRLMIWHEAMTSATGDKKPGQPPRVGPFGIGLTKNAVLVWARDAGLPGSPMSRSRKTANVLYRREPGQNTQDTHDSVYVVGEPQAQAAAVEVVAEAATEAAEAARRTVFQAQIVNAPEPEDQETATAGCSDYEHSPFSSPGSGCTASFLLCTACPNARVAPVHHPRLAHLHRALGNLRGTLNADVWASDWADAHARLEDLRCRLGKGLWQQALGNVSAADRQVIDHLLNGHYDQ